MPVPLALTLETPPRTWRRPPDGLFQVFDLRNTSTDVEKTLRRCTNTWWTTETPPRTWRRLARQCKSGHPGGNTSTDVEKTLEFPQRWPAEWKHLHGRGEDENKWWDNNQRLETPPRTWRRLRAAISGAAGEGNTSTDVEKTGANRRQCRRNGKHLHGRGEDDHFPCPSLFDAETPPRTWRRPDAHFA